MKRVITFSKYFLPAAVLSIILAIAGIVGYVVRDGFNLGIDFQAGLMQEIQLAPSAFSVTYSGPGNAGISFDRAGIYVVVSGPAVEGGRYSFLYSEYPAIGLISQALSNQVEGLLVSNVARPESPSQWLLHSAQGNPQLGNDPYVLHYLAPDSALISVRDVREALSSLGRTVSVQQLGADGERHFMVRLEDSEIAESGGGVSSERIISTLEGFFGVGEVVLIRSDYVGSRFSKNLTDQAGILLGLTLLLILIYASIRFKPQYAIGAVIAIIHDGFIMVSFIVWSRMEFNTTTIAAILTILGYSINDTIVIFDRIREVRRIYPDDSFVNILNRSLTETLSRTIITTVTTMLAVVSLYIFTSGSMKDFALALLIGMVSGVYSTVFIASGFVNLWETRKIMKEKKKLSGVPAPAKA
jgi:preprotein translocase subunit SecF